MLKAIKKIIQGYRYVYSLRLLLFKAQLKTNGVVYANFSDLGLTNYYASLAIRLVQAGYQVVILHNHKFITDCYDPIRGRVMLKWENIHVTFKKINIPPSSILISHGDSFKSIQIDPDIFPFLLNGKSLADNEIMYPFDIHLRQFSTLISGYNIQETRTVRVGFVGNLNPEVYTNTAIKDVFGMLERFYAFEKIRTTFKNRIQMAKRAEDYFPDKHCDLLLGGFGHPEIPNSTPKNFLPFLNQLDFFIALPGINIPFCHNLIEAMSQGCIPILEYGQLMPIPLQNEINCLTYKNSRELVSQINYALTLSHDEIVKMRKNVQKYYDENLSEKSRVYTIKHNLLTSDKLFIAATDISLQHFKLNDIWNN